MKPSLRYLPQIALSALIVVSALCQKYFVALNIVLHSLPLHPLLLLSIGHFHHHLDGRKRDFFVIPERNWASLY